MSAKRSHYLVAGLLASCIALPAVCQKHELAQAAASISPRASAPPPLWLGTAWYPEAWPESVWASDLALMQQSHVRFARIAEFAWSTMEPSEGVFNFDWLERAIQQAAAHNIYIVLGTPSATPPAWLTQKYPETLRMEEDGHRAEHGNRQQFDFDSPKYAELTRRMATEMAKRFGHNPNVIGWQIGNEYQKESYNPSTRADFQAWLQRRYGTLDNLNARWTTSYWSQTYSNWNQIPIETVPGNPGLLLNWKRFVSETWRAFQKNQLDAIRQNSDQRQFITTNMLGFDLPFDHEVVARDLDFASWDDYVPQGHLDAVKNGATNDLTRGFKQKNFWIMETQPGAVNWGPISNTLNEGEVRALAWHDVAHGADAIAYWQWRSAYNGQEQYHGTLVGANGKPAPVLAEVQQLGEEFIKAGPALAGTSPRSEVALVYNYDSLWAINWQKHNRNYDPLDELRAYYGPLRKLSQSVDVVKPTVALEQYKLVVAPALNVITPSEAQNLIAYVKAGGNLVLGQRSGLKDEDNGLYAQQQPGPLADLLGGYVDQYYALEDSVPVGGQFGENSSKQWAELLRVTAPETRVIASYGKSNGWLDGKPAIITRKVGRGSITYVGVWMEAAGMQKLGEWLTGMSGVKAAFGVVPDGVEVSARYGKDHVVYILVNLSNSAQTVALPSTMQDVLAGKRTGAVSLPQYGVAILDSPIAPH